MTAALAGAALGVGAGSARAETALEPLEIVTSRGVERFQVEIADDFDERARGLMFRSGLAADRGMLFVFPDAEVQSFWMKNTLISLDMLFIGADGRILNIARETRPQSRSSNRSNGPARFVLELKGGEAGRRGIGPGDRVRHRAIPG